MKLTKILLALLILTLPLIHGRVFQTLGFDFGLIVSGNFEFTKALYFNVFSGLIFSVFFIENILIGGNNLLLSLREKRVLIVVFIILCISTYFSLSPFTSLIGDLEKGHTFFLIINLLGLYIVFRQIEYSQRMGIISLFLISGIGACALAIKELYYPSFEYGALGPRALGSFGHPNYLSGFLLLLLPLIFCSPFPFAKERIQVWIKIIIIGIFIGVIILCKSLIALFLAMIYIIYISRTLSGILSLKKGKGLQYLSLVVLFLIAAFLLVTYYPQKLHSLISRWYIWETTLSIIFSDAKIIFLGAGLETLPYYFSSYKVPEMYIFENFGFTADRPHNFFLNIFYHLGVFGVGIFLYLIILFYKNITSYPSKYKALSISIIILFLLYGIFHYFSVSSYLVFIFAVSLFFNKSHVKHNGGRIFFSILVLISILGAFMSLRLHAGEIYYEAGEYKKTPQVFSHPKYFLKFGETSKASELEGVISQKNFKTQIILSDSKEEGCKKLLATYPSAENYIYCGKLLESRGEEILSKNYYNKSLKKLPDLWNEDSEYWDMYFVKHTITGNRFFSQKFGDIRGVLEKVGN